jgi:hypothetical protein
MEKNNGNTPLNYRSSYKRERGGLVSSKLLHSNKKLCTI